MKLNAYIKYKMRSQCFISSNRTVRRKKINKVTTFIDTFVFPSSSAVLLLHPA